MANLLDAINQNSSIPKQGVTDETNKLSTLLRAKQGKAGAAPALAQSNLGEQQAVAQTNQQIQQQVVPQQQIQQAAQQQQSSEIQQAENIGQQEVQQSRRENEVRTRLQTNEILGNLERGKLNINNQKDIAQLEQVGQNIRLENKKYVDDLKRAGQVARLQDDGAFREALAEATFGDSQQLLKQKLNNQSILGASERDYRKALAQLDIDDAYDIFRTEQSGAGQRATAGALGTVVTAGIGYASKKAEQDKEAAALAKEQKSQSLINNSQDARVQTNQTLG